MVGRAAKRVARAAKLLLVGVRHRDRAGAERLLGLLRRERPACVLVEVSPASLAYRRGRGRLRRRRIEALLERTDGATPRAAEAREVLSILAVPPELSAATRYVRRSRRLPRPQVVLADLSRHAVGKIDDLDRWAAEVTERLERAIDAPSFPWRSGRPRPPSDEERAESAEREAFAARRIRRALAAHAGEGIIHVCGFEHVEALSALLADLEPEIVVLTASASVP